MLRALIPFLLATLFAAGLGAAANRLPGAPSARPGAQTAANAAGEIREVGPPGEGRADGGHAEDGHNADRHAKPGARDKPGALDKPAEKGAKPLAIVAGVVALPPIVGPLRAPAQIWVRFEAAVVLEPLDSTEAKTLVAEIADDTLVYFSALSLPEIEGAAGLKAVREDLFERARLRGPGKVRDLLIQTLVTQ